MTIFFFRRTQASSPIPSAAERTRTLNVTRDDQGFGLTLSGDRPVSVQTVRPGGAAHRAGIREKDVIVKVNGAHVTQSTHTEVVDLIAGKRVILFLSVFPVLDNNAMASVQAAFTASTASSIAAARACVTRGGC